MILQRAAKHTQWKKSLGEFFQQKSVKNLVNILVPSTLAAVLFPIFGPVVAGAAASVAIKKSLDLLHISLSTETVEKILKPLEGRKIEESDVQEVLSELLPQDKKVNEEAAKVLITVVPDLKEAAQTNARLDETWLGESLEKNLKEQGGTMALLAPEVRRLTALSDEQLLAEIARLKQVWPRLQQMVSASGQSDVSDIVQEAKGHAGDISQQITASDSAKVKNVRQSHNQS